MHSGDPTKSYAPRSVWRMADTRKGDRSRTKNRVVRVTDEIWDAAKVKAEANGETISDVIRASLATYAGLKDAPGVYGRADRESN